MEDEAKEPEIQDSAGVFSSGTTQKSTSNLKVATHLLKQEAMRRFKVAHRDDKSTSAEQSSEARNNHISLRDATHKLKAEALKRYQVKHRGSLDRHEKNIEAELKTRGIRIQKSPAPSTPSIAEEGLQDLLVDEELGENGEILTSDQEGLISPAPGTQTTPKEYIHTISDEELPEEDIEEPNTAEQEVLPSPIRSYDENDGDSGMDERRYSGIDGRHASRRRDGASLDDNKPNSPRDPADHDEEELGSTATEDETIPLSVGSVSPVDSQLDSDFDQQNPQMSKKHPTSFDVEDTDADHRLQHEDTDIASAANGGSDSSGGEATVDADDAETTQQADDRDQIAEADGAKEQEPQKEETQPEEPQTIPGDEKGDTMTDQTAKQVTVSEGAPLTDEAPQPPTAADKSQEDAEAAAVDTEDAAEAQGDETAAAVDDPTQDASEEAGAASKQVEESQAETTEVTPPKAGEELPDAPNAGEQLPDAPKAGEELPDAPKAGEQLPDADKAGEQLPDADKAAEGAKEGDATEKETEEEKTVVEAAEVSKVDEASGTAVEEGSADKAEPQGDADGSSEPKEDLGPVDGTDPSIRGDEDEVMSEQIHGHDDEPKIPDDHYYNYDEHVSQAVVTEESGLPVDMLTLHHSFGYDCHKRANLHILDTETAMFVAGNVVELVNLKTKEQTYIRCTSGGGVGALAVHPSRKFFAVAEKGQAPNINIFEFPSLKLYRILRGGTEKAYSFLDFNPAGNVLASVGGDPDFMLTLWDWKQEKIVLRSKAFSQDVFRVTFSSELDGQLTSAGTGHIRFWKMAKTFTGLKLQGQLGKFGKKELSDIDGYVELPDGKVLSGSEKGNMLLWDGGLIKVEICRKGRKTCHHGPIQQIIMDEGELMTIGVDGCIRVWDFETIDTADSVDDSEMFEMEPMNELKVGSDVQLRSIVKSADAEEPTMWYAQDANGGIWKLDLSFSFTSQAPEKLLSYHAGPISGCAASPVTHLAVTTGNDKTVRVYDYVDKQPLCSSKFNSAGTSVLWAPKVVDPKGATILSGFQDGVVRVLNFQRKETVDVHGRKHKDQSEIALRQAFKPHNGAVTCMAIDNQGEILVTGGSDESLFFLSVGSNFEPIGFIKVPSTPTHLEWSSPKKDKNTLLVCCKGGQVLEIGAPEPGNFDTSHSFQISGLPIRTHEFKSIKSRLRHEEELAQKQREEEEQRRKEAEERRLRIERGLETESEQGDEEEKPATAEKEEPWEPFIPSEPSPILSGFHAQEPGKFWLSMGDFDAGYMYECEFMDDSEKAKVNPDELYEPTRTIPVHNSDDTPITSLTFSAGGKHMLMGLEDGSIRIQPLRNEDVGLMGPFWALSVHDNNYGSITHLATSFDDHYLFTVGKDGNFFTFEIMDQAKVEEKVAEAKAKIPSAKKDLKDKSIPDIEDPKAYSIEDAKQKSEHDRMMKLAEEKKTEVRGSISNLRNKFKNLIERNMKLPEHLRINRKEFEMDPEIKRQLEHQTHEKIEHVRKEMAWEEEKHQVALEKLRARFKDVVECERIVVKAFNTQHEVASFRASKLSDEFYQVKAEMEKRKTTMMSKDEASRQATKDLLAAQRTQSDLHGTGEDGKGDGETKITTSLKGSMGERITKALAKVEEKKRKRAARRAQWSELEGNKPDDDYEDPHDIAAIKQAQEHMGDYKLKSADDYVVPDHLRMNVEKARARLLVIKELIHKHKYDFNQQLLGLRDKKIRIIEEIRELVGKLDGLQSRIGEEHVRPLPTVPRMHHEEMPERKYEYTRETLVKFKEQIAMKKDRLARGITSQQGFGGFGGGAAADVKNNTPTPTPSITKQASMLSNERTMDLDGDVATMTDFEKKLYQAEQIRLVYEQDQLFKKIDDLVKNFDGELRCVRHHKMKLDIDLKNADLRLVTLYEELLLLRDFEKAENQLADKVEAKQEEKLDMQAKVIEVQQKLESKKKDIEKLVEKEKTLNTTFVTSLGDNNKFGEYLTKVFKKKIKRSKKKATDGDGSDEESDEDSDDESDWSESEEESDSEAGGLDPDVCPPGCDQTLYDNTCALREKRLDIEEALSEEKKNRDAFNKELESLQKKAKVIDSALKSAEQELEAFQLEKQRKINELDVVVTLKLHQIQHIVNNVLPQDLSQCLVFEASGVVRLQHRIKELEHEKAGQKKQQKEAKRKHIQLIKDRRVFEKRIGVMEEQCNTMMVQKFGRIVDLEKLETVTVNRQIEELKEKLRVIELQCSNELIQWDDMVRGTKDKITALIRENTNRLDQLSMLLGERKQYEGQLDSRQKNLGSEFSGARKTDVHERQRLIQLVHLQAQEIEALKDEIMLLSRKGGHILPPAQPPLPSHSAQGPRAPAQNS